MPACPINLVAALSAEAKPIASRLGLGRVQPDRGFPLYHRGQINLVVTGPGKINAAAGTAFLGSLGDGIREGIWINLGVAGHAERCVGEVLLASRITDSGSDRTWHLVCPEEGPCQADCLLTLDKPDLRYECEGMVDMEASGFFQIACRYTSIDLVQVLKVVSDNRSNPAQALRGRQVRRLMDEAFGTLERLLVRLQDRATARSGTRGIRRAD